MLTVEDIQNRLTPIFTSYGIKDAILFGSYAKGTEIPESDVDIYVDSGLRGIHFFGLLQDVTDALSIPVDLIDKQMVTVGGRLEREILTTGRRFKL